MRRYIPEVGALYARVRRSATMIGLALMVPAGGMFLRSGAESQRQMEHATLARSEASLATKVTAAKAEEGAVARIWREKALDRQRADVAKRFAREFGISESLARTIHAAAVEARIEPRVAFGLVRTESSFRRTVVSSAGAIGYTQVLPSTARWLMPGTTRSALFRPRTNLRVGFRYLRYLKNRYHGDIRLALTAYNRGPGTVDRLLRRGRNPENGYADRVLRRRG